MRYRYMTGVALALAPTHALAQQVTVESTGLTYASLSEAIAAASVGDALDLAPGVYEGAAVVDRDLTIRGAGADVVTLRWNGAGTAVLTVNAGITATISGLRLDSTSIRGILAESVAALVVEEVAFETASAGNGGGISLSGGLTTIRDSRFEGTTTGINGGAIYATSSATLEVFDSEFSAPAAQGVGGAVYVFGSAFTCTDCVVTGATASTEGGAFWAGNGATIALVGGEIRDSEANHGGAVHLNGSSLEIEGTTFADNSAVLHGGAIKAVSPTALAIQRARFCGNTANDGGAIHGALAGAGVITSSAFVQNGATSGGAAHLSGPGSWSLTNLALLGTTGGGGAVLIDTGSLTVRNSLFAHNQPVGVQSGATGGGSVVYSAFYDNALAPVFGSVTTANLLEGQDPRLAGYVPGGDCSVQQLWPTAFSPLIDAGDPNATYNDPDGSRNDIGAYGGPSADPTRHLTDADGDGVSLMKDCDDDDELVYPGAPEYCDGRDNDCNEVVDDEYALDAVLWFPDADGDGYGDHNHHGLLTCYAPVGYVADWTDCNDSDPYINPGALEYCDEIDHNCDGDPERDAVNASVWYPDEDGDGFGDDARAEVHCELPYPGWIVVGGDCDDTNPDVHPNAIEVCNGIDDNCVDGEADAPDALWWYPDADGDGFGDLGGLPVRDCFAPADHVEDATDCDDSDAAVYPGAPETCDGKDNDCNGVIDDVDVFSTWWPDRDGDGYGADGQQIEAACPPDGAWVQQGGDCDDDEAARYPVAPEICDGLDNNCNGLVDEEDPALEGIEAWLDYDGDGYGAGDPVMVCDLDGYATQPGDCNDYDPLINPGATEIPGNDVDEDCDGRALDAPSDGVPAAPVEDDTGCGCSHGSTPVGWLLPLITLLLVRRRSR